MDSSVTNLSLIYRIRSDRHDRDAWAEFIERYGSRVYQWCLNRRLQPDDAEDVTQEVLLKLARHFEKFEYDCRLTFRGWLRTVTENAIKDFVRASKVGDQGAGGSTIIALMAQEPARKELTDCLAEAFDLELLDEAKSRVQKRVNETRWQCWDWLSNQAISGKDVAERLGISVGVAYANKNQIQNMIRDEIAMLEKTV